MMTATMLALSLALPVWLCIGFVGCEHVAAWIRR